MTDAPYLSPPLEIESRFLDHNGHVNMAYHLVLVDEALELALAPIKGDGYVEGRGMTTFAAEMHVRYLCEINMGDEIRGRVRFVAADAKRTHWVVELLRTADGVVTTTAEGVSLSVDVASRKVAPFPADVAERLNAAVQHDADGAAGLDWLGRHVAMKKD